MSTLYIYPPGTRGTASAAYLDRLRRLLPDRALPTPTTPLTVLARAGTAMLCETGDGTGFPVRHRSGSTHHCILVPERCFASETGQRRELTNTIGAKIVAGWDEEWSPYGGRWPIGVTAYFMGKDPTSMTAEFKCTRQAFHTAIRSMRRTMWYGGGYRDPRA